MDNQLDQGVINLAKAIRQTESGGDYNAPGKSGEYGAYQFTEPTWKEQAGKYGINVPLKQATPEQQNAVVYNKIKEWKDAGHDVTQIASMWNAGEGEPNAYTGKFEKTTKSHKAGDPSFGVNKYNARYDVPTYAKSVSDAYLKLKGGEEVGTDPNNPSSVDYNGSDKQLTFDDIKDTPNTNTDPSAPGNFMENIGKGDYKNALKSGIANIGQATGIKDLSDYFGGELAYGVEKTKGMLGGQDNSQYVQREDASKGLSGGAKVTGLIGGLASLGAGSGALAASRASVMSVPVVEQALGGAKLASKLTRLEKLNQLGEALKTAPMGDAEQIAKAIKYLNPSKSMLRTILSKSVSAAKYYALTKLLDDKVGGFIHNATEK